MTMEDWAKHLHGILTSTGENLLIGNGTVSHLQVMNMKLEFEEEIMASSKEYLEFILGQLYELEEVSYRAKNIQNLFQGSYMSWKKYHIEQ